MLCIKRTLYKNTSSLDSSALSWTYYLKTSPNTEPFVFVGQEKEYEIYPEEGDLIIFPSVMNHRVSVSQTDDERIVIVGNIR